MSKCEVLSLPWQVGHTPSTAGTFRKKFRKNSGKTPETLSERFLEFPSRVRLGCPKPSNSRHLGLSERFQNSLPPSTAGDASFFRIGSGEGLSELVMEFPAVLGVFLSMTTNSNIPDILSGCSHDECSKALTDSNDDPQNAGEEAQPSDSPGAPSEDEMKVTISPHRTIPEGPKIKKIIEISSGN